MASLHQIRYDRDVRPGLANTFPKGAGAVSHLQAHVPEEADKVLDPLDVRAGTVRREQDQEINIGARMQFLASVTPYRDKRQLGLPVTIINQVPPKMHQQTVDELTVCAENGVRSNLCRMCRRQARPSLLQLGFAAADREILRGIVLESQEALAQDYDPRSAAGHITLLRSEPRHRSL